MSYYTIAGTVLILVGTGLTAFGNWKSSNQSSKEIKGISSTLDEQNRLMAEKESKIQELEGMIAQDIAPYLERRKYRIVKACQDIRQSIYWASFYPQNAPRPYPEEGFPTSEELKLMLQKIEHDSVAPVKYLPESGLSWPAFFELKMKSTKEAISDIHSKSDVVDSKLIKNIAEIEDSNFFSFIPKMIEMEKREKQTELDLGKKIIHKPNNIEVYFSSLNEYFNLIKHFEDLHIEFPEGQYARKYPSE